MVYVKHEVASLIGPPCGDASIKPLDQGRELAGVTITRCSTQEDSILI